ncbi:MAG: zinc ribbon domain-containing protein [Clostridia bacterium]|nr:zinc ribbon domain-containing protein [Clostridia bacterium]
MSRLTDKISYLQGLAEGMKLNPEKDSHRLIQGILEVLGEVGESFEALAESHGELSDYVESIDEDLADLEADLFDDEDEDLAGDEEEDDAEDGEDPELSGVLLSECPNCGKTVELDPEELDSEDRHPCPNCGKELFPELPEETDED